MRTHLYHRMQAFVLTIFFALLTPACYQLPTQRLEAPETPVECRVVQHNLGETCIPSKPQRIVVLDPYWVLDSLLSLGVKPVGTTIIEWQGRRYFTGLTTDEVNGIEIVGTTQQPSLEKVLLLKPDLIFLASYQGHIYQQVSRIAPTIVEEWDKFKLSFRDYFRSTAQLINREEKVDEVLYRYQQRVEEVRETLGDRSKDIKISVIVYDGDFSLPPSYEGFFQVLNDIGLHLKPVFLTQQEWSRISIETIHEYDADVLFIVNFSNQSPSFFLQNPLIASLKSARNNQAYVVDSTTWEAYGPLGINKLLDDICRYLLEAGQNFSSGQ